jgi:2-amino-4-hydroxy-6-hydroxymethyldihydropteridine diphosphokinase
MTGGSSVLPPVRRVYLGLGSNLGDRLEHLQEAVDGIARVPGIAVTGVSGVYATTPVGGPEQPDYLNAVVALETALSAHEILDLAQQLEVRARRVRSERWGPRTLDVDVLLVGDERVDDPDLVVPHPRMAERAFVVVPLADLEPAWADRRPPDPVDVRLTRLQLRVPE